MDLSESEFTLSSGSHDSGALSIPADSTDDFEVAPSDEELAALEPFGRAIGRALRASAIDTSKFNNKTIGQYSILRFLGSGGSGIVYHAIDPNLSREVAIKIANATVGYSSDLRARFLQEAKLLAELLHSNIVTIFSAGVDEEWPYLVFEYCAGGSLRQWFDRQSERPSPATCARIIQTLAEAAHFAHVRGIIHRDINPRNVLLVPLPPSEITAENFAFPFIAKLADFGMGTWLHERTSAIQTQAGAIMGTLPYMAPEQTQTFEAVRCPTVDVYALGIVLYELLTGQRPFAADTSAELIKLIRESAPKPPRQLRSDIPQELETICLRCIDGSPEGRFRTARELADDLQRYLSGAPVHARRTGMTRKVIRWAKKNAWQLGVRSFSVAIMCVIAVGGILLNNSLTDARKEIHQEQGRASRYQTDFYAVQIQRASQPKPGSYEVVQQLRKLIPQAADEEKRGFEWYYLMHINGGESASVAGLPPIGDKFQVMRLCAADQSIILAHRGELTQWDSLTGRRVRILTTFPYPIHAFDINRDKSRLVIAFEGRRDLECYRLDADGLKLLAICGADRGEVWQTVEFASHDRIVTTSRFLVKEVPWMQVRYFDTNLREDRKPSKWQQSGFIDARIDTSDELLVAALKPRMSFFGLSDNAYTKDNIWSHRLVSNPPHIPPLAISEDNSELAVTLADGSILVMKKSKGEWQDSHTSLPSDDEIREVLNDGAIETSPKRFTSDGKFLLSGTGNRLDLWDVTLNRLVASIRNLPGHELINVDWLADDKTAVWATRKNVGVWRPSFEPPQVAGHSKEAWAVHFSPDGRLLATGSDDETVAIWNVADGTKLHELKEHIATVTKVAFSPTGNLLASAGLDGLVCIWNPQDGSLKRSYPHIGPVRQIAWFADGKRFVTSDCPRLDDMPRISIWNAETGELERRWERLASQPSSIVISADQSSLTCSFDDGTIQTWKVDSQAPPRIWEIPTIVRSAIMIDHDKTLVIGDSDGKIYFRATNSTKVSEPLVRHKDRVLALAISPDGRTLASGGDDHIIRLWNVETGSCLVEINDQPAQINSLAFSPDGTILAAAAHDGSVKLYYGPRSKPLQFGEQANRDLVDRVQP